MNWEEKSRARRIGDRHKLEALPSFWFRPQRYSIQGDEAISLAQLRLKDRFKPDTIRRILDKVKDNPDPQGRIEDLLLTLDDEDLSAIMEEASGVPAGAQTEYKRLVLLHGIGEHNFKNAKEELESVSEDFVDRILQDKELTDEMVAVIVRWNRPLLKGSALRSRTSSNGSIEGSSPKKEKNTRTDRSPAS
jgi:hypothetical protein